MRSWDSHRVTTTFRLLLFVIVAIVLAGCDGYIEELRVQADGSVDLSARAIVVCTDPLQQAIWDGDPCDAIDEANQTGEFGDLPFGFDFDSDRVGFVVTGEADRRTIDVTWEGTAEEMSSVLANPGSITQLNEQETEVVFTSAGTPFLAIADSDDPDIVTALQTSRWQPSEFRINAPDLVIDHNGDDIQGRIVIWNIDGDEPDEFRIVFTTEDPPSRLWWVGGVSLIFLVVLTMMVKLEPRSKKR